MLKVGELTSGPFWPEMVEIRKCERIGDTLFIVEALGCKTNQYYEQILNLEDIERLEKSKQRSKKESASFTAKDIQHFLQYYALKIDQQYSVSRKLGNSKLIPLPHQIEAVYSRMLQTPKVRFLLADDPGAGKTIMAGMLIRELRARKCVERILILVPPLVLRQWQEELKEKFNEEFTIITRETINHSQSNPFEQFDCCLASMYWAARDEVKALVLKADFDLIIVDEAHKMAAYTRGKKQRKVERTKLYQLGEALLHHVEHCLLLTATPHKGDPENFRHLMRLIDPDIFSNIDGNKSLREKSNPFIIRRLKENMVTFEGTPLFPKRTTKTIEFELSQMELDLYESVTNYVRKHFNRAVQKGNNSTAFAMMLLQRRLSSSIEAIHLSLERRKEKLVSILEQLFRGQREILDKNDEVWDEEEWTLDEIEEKENELEGSTDAIDIEELKIEIQEIERLLTKTSTLRRIGIERKYRELERTLFGPNGLLKQGEKILIFTEATDTLRYLEKKLLEHVPKVAVITGEYSMDHRRQQVELFRNEAQIMLATDAGGESINLQFCNQMINYDIPWNPNRLEQRMGRIHRIGQKNEVFVFNLVAKNTREGYVLSRLLQKIEQMREDLGENLVYDIIGEILEDKDIDLPTLMQNAILNRERLDDIVSKLDKTLSEEHKRLIEIVQAERLDETSFDLPGIRRQQYDVMVKSLPARVYGEFTKHSLEKANIKMYVSQDNKTVRIDRIPKSIREYARRKGILLPAIEQSYRFTIDPQKESDNIGVLTGQDPLFKLALELTEKAFDHARFKRYKILYPTKEPIFLEVHEVSIVDGTGREIDKSLLTIGKRLNGDFIYLDPYWLFQLEWTDVVAVEEVTEDYEMKIQSIKKAQERLNEIRNYREKELTKKIQFLRRVFEEQYQDTLKRLETYRKENTDQRNSALINQMNAQLEEIEDRREMRLQELERERTIQLKPTRRIIQLELIPNESRYKRVFPVDWLDNVKQYENRAGRSNVKAFDAFALVDFYSETYDGKPRYIILQDENTILDSQYLKDLDPIKEHVYIYYVANNREIIREELLV